LHFGSAMQLYFITSRCFLSNLEIQENARPGIVVLFGSGETSPNGRKVFDYVLKDLPQPPRLALLETPAGFELNSAQVIGRVAEFIRHRLQNYQPQVTLVPARKRGTPDSPDEPQIVAPLLESDLIFMGPGSPSYAVRQLSDSLAWHYLLARHRLGAALVLASAATIAISAHALPVYEIYKVGEDPHWKNGLDFFGSYGLPLVFVPHWNNNDGGDELDTSRCFMGQPRFAELMEQLPPDITVIGIDEKTALVMDLTVGVCRVIGLGGVTLIHTGHHHPSPGPDLGGTGLAEVAEQRDSHVHIHHNGEGFPLSECCPLDARLTLEGLPPLAWKQALEAQVRLQAERLAAAEAPPASRPVAADVAPDQVQSLLAARQEARLRKDWPAADALRLQIAELGWQVVDTPEGPKLVKG
jgi:cyanophycinase-like exopeptidase